MGESKGLIGFEQQSLDGLDKSDMQLSATSCFGQKGSRALPRVLLVTKYPALSLKMLEKEM